MPRTFRLTIPVGLFLLAGLLFPSAADAQRRGGGGNGGGGGARGTAVARGGGGGPAVRGGAVYGRSHVAVPRSHHSYSAYRPYYGRPYYRPYYSGYSRSYYSPWSFSLSFGFGWYGGAYAPYYAYPYYPYPYVTPYPAYGYPSPYPPAAPYASANPSQPQYASPTADNGYGNSLSTSSRRTYQADVRTTTARVDDRGEFGTLSIRVMPSDATILIDQEAWERPRGDDPFSLEVGEGSHQVEIRKAGYTTYVRTVDVPRGRSVVLNVALTPGGTRTIQVARTVPFRQ
jgi:hypothetical protein